MKKVGRGDTHTLILLVNACLKMVLPALSFLARLGALASSIIVLGLGAKFIINRGWSVEFLIYIEVVAALSIIGSLIPPFPNFLYDIFWAVMWLLAAVFALVVQVHTPRSLHSVHLALLCKN